ncbi:MAG: hypothetical protein WCA46_19815, partial [Actinocatenispora sp.]
STPRRPPGNAQAAASFESSFRVGCGSPWSGAAAAALSGATATSAVFRWQAGSGVHKVAMTRTSGNVYRAEVSGLPVHTAVRWWVQLSTADGRTVDSQKYTAKPNCLL